jgi:Transposase IS200 like
VEIDGEEIFRDERDRWKFLGYLAEGAERYRVKVQCYVLMENHFHLVATTPEGSFLKWMHQLKTANTVYFTRRHQVVGHLFQGRFKSTVVEVEKYFAESEPLSASQPGARNGAGPGNADGAPGTSARVPLEQLPGLRRVGEKESVLGQ